jgi:hypothetical protein
MKTRASLWAAVFVAFSLGPFAAGAPLAQTETTVEVRNFEVLAVDGNRLILRDKRGTQVFTVPNDFRFKVGGRQLSAKQLKPGMKGQATVTTTTTVTPVTLTEFRDAVVVSTTGMSVTIRGADGVARRFSQSELDKRGIEMIKDGRVIRVTQLNPGDHLTATLISNQPPTVVTETEIDVKLAQAKTETSAERKTSAAPASTVPATAASAPAPVTTAAPEAVVVATPATSDAVDLPQQWGSRLPWVAALIALAALVAYLVLRKKH